VTAIGEVVRKVSTWNPSRSSSAEPFSYVDLSSVDQDAKRITCARTTRPADAPSRARQLLERGDVLVSTVRPNLNAVAYVTDEFHGATASTGFTVLRPADRIDGRYLFHWVQSPAFVQGMVAMATGASYPAVSDRIVKESSLPLPPIEEQRRIAAILDHAAHLASMRAASLQQLDASEAAQFNALFGNMSSHGNGARPLRGGESPGVVGFEGQRRGCVMLAAIGGIFGV
jgi:type I restriction enzyme S subunit